MFFQFASKNRIAIKRTKIDFMNKWNYSYVVLHQPQNTYGNKINEAKFYSNIKWFPHFHRSYELIVCLKGSANVDVEDRHYLIKEKELIIVFPYQTHSFVVEGESLLYVLVFSPDLMNSQLYSSGLVPANPLFEIKDYEWEFLTHSLFQNKHYDLYDLASSIAIINGNISKNISYVKRSDNSDVIAKIIEYVDRHYLERITLKLIAKEIGYNYQYVSRLFGKTMNISFPDFINQYRIEHAERLLNSSNDKTITQIALESGFGSIRNYNRVLSKKRNVLQINEFELL